MMESTAEQNRAIDTQHVGGSASPAELDAAPTARRSDDLSSATTSNSTLASIFGAARNGRYAGTVNALRTGVRFP
jgi:hypothetical protein